MVSRTRELVMTCYRPGTGATRWWLPGRARRAPGRLLRRAIRWARTMSGSRGSTASGSGRPPSDPRWRLAFWTCFMYKLLFDRTAATGPMARWAGYNRPDGPLGRLSADGGGLSPWLVVLERPALIPQPPTDRFRRAGSRLGRRTRSRRCKAGSTPARGERPRRGRRHGPGGQPAGTRVDGGTLAYLRMERQLFGSGVPAEAADGGQGSGGTPGQQHAEVLPVEPAVLGERAKQGQVERPHRQRAGDAVQHVGVDRHIAAGDEDQGEQDQLHDRRRGLGIADEGGHRDAQCAETGRPEHERHRD